MYGVIVLRDLTVHAVLRAAALIVKSVDASMSTALREYKVGEHRFEVRICDLESSAHIPDVFSLAPSYQKLIRMCN